MMSILEYYIQYGTVLIITIAAATSVFHYVDTIIEYRKQIAESREHTTEFKKKSMESKKQTTELKKQIAEYSDMIQESQRETIRILSEKLIVGMRCILQSITAADVDKLSDKERRWYVDVVEPVLQTTNLISLIQ